MEVPKALPARSNFAPESRLVAFGEGACEAKVTRFKRAVAEDTYTYLDEANGKQACTGHGYNCFLFLRWKEYMKIAES